MRQTHTDILDAGLNIIRNDCDKMVLLELDSETSITYAQANGALKLAEVSMTSSDFSIGNAIESGRQVVVAEKTTVPVTTSGDGNHLALLDTSGERVLHVTPTSVAAVANPGSFNSTTWRVEIQDPIAFGA